MNNRQIRVAVILLPVFIFLAFASASFADSDIQATVRVVPSATMTCLPNPFISGLRDKVITCYVELDNYDVEKIKIETLRLSMVEVTVIPIPVTSNSPNRIGDFNKNHIKDLRVTFDRATIERWIPNLFFPNELTLKLNGEIEGVSNYVFTTTSRIKFIKPPYTFVYFAKGGEVKMIEGIDLSKATISSAVIGKRDQQLISLDSSYITRGEAMLGTVSGKIPMPFIFNRYINLGFTSWVTYDEGSCEFNPDLSVVCEGTGKFFKRGLAVGYSREDVDIHFRIIDGKASLTAKHDGKIVFEMIDFEYVEKAKLPFIYN